MTKLLISLARKRGGGNERQKMGVMSGFVGIICNVLLCITKFTVGSLTGSVSITADAINNLSDAASNIVTIIGSKLSAKPVDKEHPFGHGRMEYISALVVAFFIFLMGFELGKSSIDKIINQSELQFNIIYIIAIIAAILVKLWMAYFNNKLYKMTDNINLKAVRQDSLNDCISTSATIGALVLSHFLGIPWIDGAVGLAVSVFIIFSGIGIVKEILDPLLGQPPQQETVDQIKQIMLDEEMIVGVHDLIVHDYGPGKIIASAHAEVPSNIDVIHLHEIIDAVEKKINEEMNIIICIHMDPIVVDDEEVAEYREMCDRIITAYDPSLSFHDFRMVKGEKQINLIFDLVTDFDKDTDKEKIRKDLTDLFVKEDPKFNPIMMIEHSYT